MELSVAGQNVIFLLDSGATHSVIKAEIFPVPPAMSGRYENSIGASGKILKDL